MANVRWSVSDPPLAVARGTRTAMRVAPVTTSQHAFSQTAPQDDPHRTDGHQWDEYHDGVDDERVCRKSEQVADLHGRLPRLRWWRRLNASIDESL